MRHPSNVHLNLKKRYWASIQSDNYEGLKNVLDDGADVDLTNERGYTGLIETLQKRKERKNWPKIAGLLIFRGANARKKYGNKRTPQVAAQDLIIQIDNTCELEIVDQYARGTETV